MGLTSEEWREVPQVEEEPWQETVFNVIEGFQTFFARHTAQYFIESFLPRPAGAKDSLTSTILMTSFPSASGFYKILIATGVSFSTVVFSIAPWYAVYTNETTNSYLRSNKRVVTWAPITWSHATHVASVIALDLIGYAGFTLIPTRLRQGRFKGIRSIFQDDLIGNWKLHTCAALLTLPHELTLLYDLDGNLCAKFLDSPEEEEEVSLKYVNEEEEGKELITDSFQKKLLKSGFHIAFRGILGLMLVPFDVVLAHMLSGEPKYNSLTKCVTSLWAEGGLLAFFRGAFPFILCSTFNSGYLLSIWFGLGKRAIEL